MICEVLFATLFLRIFYLLNCVEVVGLDLFQLLGDLYFKEGVDKVIRSLAAMSRFPIYYYRFSHEGTLSPIAVFSYNDIPGIICNIG